MSLSFALESSSPVSGASFQSRLCLRERVRVDSICSQLWWHDDCAVLYLPFPTSYLSDHSVSTYSCLIHSFSSIMSPLHPRLPLELSTVAVGLGCRHLKTQHCLI